jgi:hypothetical protein
MLDEQAGRAVVLFPLILQSLPNEAGGINPDHVLSVFRVTLVPRPRQPKKSQKKEP